MRAWSLTHTHTHTQFLSHSHVCALSLIHTLTHAAYGPRLRTVRLCEKSAGGWSWILNKHSCRSVFLLQAFGCRIQSQFFFFFGNHFVSYALRESCIFFFFQFDLVANFTDVNLLCQVSEKWYFYVSMCPLVMDTEVYIWMCGWPCCWHLAF